MERILLKGGITADPASGRVEKADVYIENGVVKAIGGSAGDIAEQSSAEEAVRVIDVSGMIVTCGLIDMHVHLRDPGQEYKEDIITGGSAAVRGGVTGLAAMPNTVPPVDDVETLSYILDKAKGSPAKIYQIASVTEDMKGLALNDLEKLAAAGAIGFSEDGKSVLDSELLEEAMRRAAILKLPVISHCEEPSLVRGGVMNDDENAARLGLPGICNESETVIVERDIELARKAGCHLHICHVSAWQSVEAIRKAKAEGADISAETCPHYLALTSDDIPCDDGNYKMNPPLRSMKDRDALREAVADGTIDVIVTDHAPHSAEEKSKGFMGSPFGIIGMETSFPVMYTTMVRSGIITLPNMLHAMSTRPAGILGVEGGRMECGTRDLAVFDIEHPYRIDAERFASKGRNTPFDGMEVYGRTVLTIVDGKIVFEDI